MDQGFPAHAFGVRNFDAMAARAGAATVLTLDVSTAVSDTSLPSLIASRVGKGRATKFEIGNEVYDPRQGPCFRIQCSTYLVRLAGTTANAAERHRQ